jgi:uncharacterized phage protein (TIGR02218 family)
LRLLAAQFLDIAVKADAGEALLQTTAQRRRRSRLATHRIAQDVANLLLHAAAVAAGASLQQGFDVFFKITHDKLGHERLPFRYHDIVCKGVLARSGVATAVDGALSMKSVSAALDAHLQQEVTTLATCWRIIRTDGAAFFFTDHDRDLEFEGDRYVAAAGYSRSAIASDASFGVDNLDVEGVFDNDAITDGDLKAGLFDHAEVRIFLVNWADLSQGALRLRRGWFGEVVLGQPGIYRTELRGLTQALAQRIGELYSPECRADLGDNRCKVDLGVWRRNGAVTGVIDRLTFTAGVDGGPFADGWFDGGVLTFTTGADAGRSIEVRAWTAAEGRIALFLPPPFAAAVGDTFHIVLGCDKRLATCRDRYANVLNFRGEPYLPGQDALTAYPDAH